MSTDKQLALLLESAPGEFNVGERDIPKPSPGELLVKVKAAALNPVDWKIQRGFFPIINTFPAVLGTDIAGDVEEVGDGVTNFSKGDRVLCQGLFQSDYSGFQQYTLSNSAITVKIPAKMTYEAASTIPLALATAYVGLFNAKPHGFQFPAPLEPLQRGRMAGTPLVVLGGSSSVGQFVIQLAKASGLSPIITTSSLKHTDFLKSLGATHVLNRNISARLLRGEIDKITTVPIEYVYDAISSQETQQAGHDILVSGGQLVLVLSQNIKKADDKTVTQVFAVSTLPKNRENLVHMCSKLTELLEDGVIVPSKHEALPGGLGGISAGLRRLENNQVSGMKLVACPWQESV